MIKPNATKYNPDPDYLRGLVKRSGLTQAKAAKEIGISHRLLQQYMANRAASSARTAPYPIQYALESLPPLRGKNHERS